MLHTSFLNEDIQAKPEHKYAVVVAEFNKEYTQKMMEDCVATLKQKGANVEQVVWVPGAFELPLAAQNLLEKGFDAVLTLGVVIRGDTSHYDHVCEGVIQGVMRVSLDYKKPVIFGLLTCENRQQVEERMPRSKDLALTAIQMANLI